MKHFKYVHVKKIYIDVQMKSVIKKSSTNINLTGLTLAYCSDSCKMLQQVFHPHCCEKNTLNETKRTSIIKRKEYNRPRITGQFSALFGKHRLDGIKLQVYRHQLNNQQLPPHVHHETN